MRRKTVNEMFDYARNNNLKLLSDFEANFWQEYLANYSQYDALFRRMFFSFKYYLQYGDESVETVTNDFINEVKHHLMLNKKKYEELYRIYTLADDKYSLTDNYNVTETMNRETGSKDTNTYGSFETVDSMDKDRTNTHTNIYGEREDSSTINTGEQNNNITEQVTTFDSDSFNDNKKNIESNGAREDNVTNTKGSQTDSLTNTEEEDYTLTNTKKEHTDTLNNTGTEKYTYTKVGNIGVQTVTDILSKHEKFWSGYMFYEKIFEDICAELLIV